LISFSIIIFLDYITRTGKIKYQLGNLRWAEQIYYHFEIIGGVNQRQESRIQPVSRYGLPIKTAKGHDTSISDFTIDHSGTMAVF
jgi:hypothetical protein